MGCWTEVGVKSFRKNICSENDVIDQWMIIGESSWDKDSRTAKIIRENSKSNEVNWEGEENWISQGIENEMFFVSKGEGNGKVKTSQANRPKKHRNRVVK